MSTKDKILKALDCALDDISEGRLVDILLDAYKAKNRRIEELEAENESERQSLHREREGIRAELHKMRCDPIYGKRGEYFFMCDGRKFCVHIQGRVDMFERRGNINYAAQSLGMGDWLKANGVL